MKTFMVVLACLIMGGSSVSLQNENMVIDFPFDTPSFSVGPTNVTQIIGFSFSKFIEAQSSGNQVRSYSLPEAYKIEKDSYIENGTTYQNLTFTSFIESAHLSFTFMLISTTKNQTISLFSLNQTYHLFPNLPLCYFSFTLTGWKYLNPTNVIQIAASISAKVDALSVGYSETAQSITVGIPYNGTNFLNSVISKFSIVDDLNSPVTTSFSITSLSNPIGANIQIQFKHSNDSITFSSYAVVAPLEYSISIVSIIIVVCLSVGLAILMGLGIFFVVRYYRNINKGEEENVNKKSGEDGEKEKKSVKRNYKATATTEGTLVRI